MADRQYFTALGQALEAAAAQREIEVKEVRARAEGATRSRSAGKQQTGPDCIPSGVTASAHDSELAVSWQVDIAYMKACTYDRLYQTAVKKAFKVHERPYLGRAERQALADEAHAGFKGVPDKPLRVDCFIYFKDHNIAPEIDPGMAPAFGRAFHGAPLHHHFAIWRMQRPNPSSGTSDFTDWYAFDDYALGQGASVERFLDATGFRPCPPESNRTNRFWRWVAGGAVAGIAAFAVLFTLFQEPLARVFGFATPADRREMEIALQQLREDVAVLREQYATEMVFVEAYENEISRMRSGGASPGEIEELNAALRTSRRRIDELGRQLSQAGERLAPASGAGLPACWTRETGQTAYLFEAYLDDRGIRLSWAPGAAERARAEALPVHGIVTDTALSTPSFTEATRPILAASEANEPRCRHYVILREGVHASASGYQRQREAVERHFYIYRP